METFRFSTKTQYEDELVRNITKRQTEKLSEQEVLVFEKDYEELIEEFFRFLDGIPA